MATGQVLLVAFLIGAAMAMATMLAIALSTLGRTTDSSVREDRVRTLHQWWFIALLTAVIAAFIISTRWFPYPTIAENTSSRHFSVVAQQYHFQVPAEVPVNTHIIFDVTSTDVNHGFGIYDPHGTLLGQVQAMPNYVNHLPFYFRRIGRYTIRCLEYCGIGHPAMLATFRVR
jgi:cytochrome c oxidase subunit 2